MRRILIALFLLVTLPVLAENSILIMGDSISAGYGIDLDEGWVNLLRQRLKQQNYNYRVINASISGDTTSNGLNRLPAALKKFKPSITIIELSGNDGLRGLPITTIQTNLHKMIELAQAAGSKVLVLGLRLPPNYGPAYTQQFHQIFIQLQKRVDIKVVPLFLMEIDENKMLMQPDGIHPSTQAQQLILDNVWPELKKLL